MFENLPNDIIIDILIIRRFIKEKNKLENIKKLNLKELETIGTFYWMYNNDSECDEYFEKIKNREIKPFKLISNH